MPTFLILLTATLFLRTCPWLSQCLAISDSDPSPPLAGCEQCANCKAGDSHLCVDNRCGTTEMGQGLKPGGFASHVPVSHCKYVVKVRNTAYSIILYCILYRGGSRGPSLPFF